MGTKYPTQATSGYNSSPPPDDGSTVAANKVTWATIKTKLSDVLKTFGEAINTALVNFTDFGSTTTSGAYTTLASDHMKTIEATGTITVSLMTAATAAAGYIAAVANLGTGIVTVAVITATDTLNGTVNGTFTIPPGECYTFKTISAATGYIILAGNRTVQDSTFRIVGSSDVTKKVAFEVDGLTTATTRTLTVPDANGTIALTSQIVLRSYLAGCGVANGTDAVNDLNIAAGQCADSTNAVMIAVAAMAGKQLDANWAPGAAAGMRNSAVAIANTTYHIYAVSKADGTQDIYAHTSTTVATVITALQAESGGSAYLYARRIFSVVRTGGTLALLTQDGDYVRFAVSVQDIATANPGTASVTATLASLPTGINVQAILNALYVYAGAQSQLGIYLRDLAANDEAPTDAGVPGFSVELKTGSANPGSVSGMQTIRTNTSAQIGYRVAASDANLTVRIITLGYFDRRGRDA